LHQDNGDKDVTAAQSLLNYLESVDGLEYKTLIGTYDEATDCVTVRQQNKYSGKTAELKEGNCNCCFTICLYVLNDLYNSFSFIRIFNYVFF